MHISHIDNEDVVKCQKQAILKARASSKASPSDQTGAQLQRRDFYKTIRKPILPFQTLHSDIKANHGGIMADALLVAGVAAIATGAGMSRREVLPGLEFETVMSIEEKTNDCQSLSRRQVEPVKPKMSFEHVSPN